MLRYYGPSKQQVLHHPVVESLRPSYQPCYPIHKTCQPCCSNCVRDDPPKKVCVAIARSLIRHVIKVSYIISFSPFVRPIAFYLPGPCVKYHPTIAAAVTSRATMTVMIMQVIRHRRFSLRCCASQSFFLVFISTLLRSTSPFQIQHRRYRHTPTSSSIR